MYSETHIAEEHNGLIPIRKSNKNGTIVTQFSIHTLTFSPPMKVSAISLVHCDAIRAILIHLPYDRMTLALIAGLNMNEAWV